MRLLIFYCLCLSINILMNVDQKSELMKMEKNPGLTIMLSFIVPPTWWRFLMVSSMRLCQSAAGQRLDGWTTAGAAIMKNKGNSPTMGSFLKGILERDRFSISRHTAQSHVGETTESVRCVKKDWTCAGFGTYLPVSSALHLNPCRDNRQDIKLHSLNTLILVSGDVPVLFPVLELKQKSNQKIRDWMMTDWRTTGDTNSPPGECFSAFQYILGK